MNGDEESMPIYVWNGILEPKHRDRIGPAIWLFLYLIDRTTKERPNVHAPEETEGWVYGKMPLTLSRMAEETGIPERTLSHHLLRLERHDYIRTIRAPHGLIILVQKSGKWPKGKKSAPERPAKNGESRYARNGESPANFGESSAKNGECRKDKAVDLSGDESIGGRNTALGAVVFSRQENSLEAKPEEEPQPQEKTFLTGEEQYKDPETVRIFKARVAGLAKPPRQPEPVSQAELDEQLRILRERYAGQFQKWDSRKQAAAVQP